MKTGLKLILAIILCIAVLVAAVTPLWMLITTIILKDSLEQWYFIVNILIAGLLVILESVGLIYYFGESHKKETKPQRKHTDYEDFQ